MYVYMYILHVPAFVSIAYILGCEFKSHPKAALNTCLYIYTHVHVLSLSYLVLLQLSTLGNPVAPNASVQPSSGVITAHVCQHTHTHTHTHLSLSPLLPIQVKEKKPHIKKPLNAFMLFMKEKRAEVIKQCTLKESAAINQILGKMVSVRVEFTRSDITFFLRGITVMTFTITMLESA